MVATLLVDFESGSRVIELLDESRMSPVAAFWRYLSDGEEWRLFLAFDSVDSDGKRITYGKVQNVIHGSGALTLADITVISPKDKLLIALRKMLRHQNDLTTPVRVSGTPVDGFYVEDALIYRL